MCLVRALTMKEIRTIRLLSVVLGVLVLFISATIQKIKTASMAIPACPGIATQALTMGDKFNDAIDEPKATCNTRACC